MCVAVQTRDKSLPDYYLLHCMTSQPTDLERRVGTGNEVSEQCRSVVYYRL